MQPQIEIVVRIRGGGYALPAAQAHSRSQQVADRWQLMEYTSQAFLDAVRLEHVFDRQKDHR